MPYIEKEYREKLDKHIDELAETIARETKDDDKAFSGLLNYVCTRLAALLKRLEQLSA